MKEVILRCFLALCFAMLHGANAQPPDAARNPFGRPSAERQAESAVPSSGTPAPTFRLRATMTAGSSSLVNVDGEIVRLGDEIAGYRLIAVGEGTALFVRNGVRYPLTMNSDGSDDDEQQ